jgi:hypothetical protein
MIFPFPFSGTRSRISLCSSRNPGQKICSRKFVLEYLLSEICSRKFVPGILGKPKAVSSSFFQFISRFLLLAFIAATKLNQHKVGNKTYSLSLSLFLIRLLLFIFMSLFLLPSNHRASLSKI